MAKHPEVKNLFGFCPRQKYWVTLSVVAQIFFAYLLRDQSWWLIIPLAYVVGGTINHSLFLAFHELAHNLFFDRPVHNTLFGFFANLPMTLAITVYVQFASATRLRAPLKLAIPFLLRRAPWTRRRAFGTPPRPLERCLIGPRFSLEAAATVDDVAEAQFSRFGTGIPSFCVSRVSTLRTPLTTCSSHEY